MSKGIYASINTLWQYMQMDHEPELSDCIFCMCSNDPRVAEYAAELYLEGFAPKLIFSGGVGRFTEGMFDKPEAEVFAEIAVDKGVPERDILIENRSTNSGENIRFTSELLEELDYYPERFILVQKPYMVRRAYASFLKQWPRPTEHVVSVAPPIAFSDYLTEELPSSLVIPALLGDFQRVIEYPERGFQIPQPVSVELLRSFEQIRLAYPAAE